MATYEADNHKTGKLLKAVTLAIALLALIIAIIAYFKLYASQAITQNNIADGAVSMQKLDPQIATQLEQVVALASRDGQNGRDGETGQDGSDGRDGVDGTDGSDGAPGLPGAQGAPGAQGPQGDQGAQGAQGSSGVLSTVLGDGLNGSVSNQTLSLSLIARADGGVEVGQNGISLVSNCSSQQILKYSAGSWVCANDEVGQVATANLTSSTLGVTVTGGTGAVLGTGTAISIATATGSQNGLLSSADWTTFNNKSAALTFIGNGLFTRSGNTVTGTTCTSSQIFVFDGTNWVCAANTDNDTTYSAGPGIGQSGTVFSLDPTSLSVVSSMTSTDSFIVSTASGARTVSYDNLFSGVLGSLNYRSTWDALLNQPDLSAYCTAGTKGHYYVVNVAGNANLNGITSWNQGDWAVCNGTGFEKIETSNLVSSVFGRTGAISAAAGDYNASQITNTPSGGITATTVQAAINQIEANKLNRALSSGQIWIGDNANTAQAVTVSGDATLSNTGVFTIADGAITSNKLGAGSVTFASIGTNGCTNGQIIRFNGTTWACADAGSGLAIGSLDGASANSNGATLLNGVLTLQSASTTQPGLVTTGAQSFAGLKTFINGLVINTSATSGAALTIGRPTSGNVLPLSITSANNQIARFTNGADATNGYYTGTGSPEGVVVAPVGSFYSATDTGTMYTKRTGVGNTGWSALVTTTDLVAQEPEYLSVVRSGTNQSLAGGTGINIIFNSKLAGNIPYDTSTGIATLSAGKTYSIRVSMHLIGGSPRFTQYALVNAANNAQIGPKTELVAVTSGSNNASPGYLDIIYEPTVTTQVRVRVVGGNTEAGESIRHELYSGMTITQIGS